MKTPTLKTLTASLAAALMFAGCSLGSSSADLGNMTPAPNAPNPIEVVPPVTELPPPSETPPTETTPTPPAPTCDIGLAYAGFAGTDLTAGRIPGDLGPERGRVKPFTALVGEVPRVLGSTPGMLADPSVANTFGIIPARWDEEAQGSGVGVYTMFRIAFQGCLTATATPAKFAAVPSNTTAAAECGTWARNFWSRTATQPEVDACVKVAMVDTAKETDPKRRWAYTCASVMTAAGFTTY
jgi:hypothetical protein